MATQIWVNSGPGIGQVAIIWTNVDFPLKSFIAIHMTAISQQVPMLSFCIMSLKITLKIIAIYPRGQWINVMNVCPVDNVRDIYHINQSHIMNRQYSLGSCLINGPPGDLDEILHMHF